MPLPKVAAISTTPVHNASREKRAVSTGMQAFRRPVTSMAASSAFTQHRKSGKFCMMGCHLCAKAADQTPRPCRITGRQAGQPFGYDGKTLAGMAASDTVELALRTAFYAGSRAYTMPENHLHEFFRLAARTVQLTTSNCSTEESSKTVIKLTNLRDPSMPPNILSNCMKSLVSGGNMLPLNLEIVRPRFSNCFLNHQRSRVASTQHSVCWTKHSCESMLLRLPCYASNLMSSPTPNRLC